MYKININIIVVAKGKHQRRCSASVAGLGLSNRCFVIMYRRLRPKNVFPVFVAALFYCCTTVILELPENAFICLCTVYLLLTIECDARNRHPADAVSTSIILLLLRSCGMTSHEHLRFSVVCKK